MFTPFNYNREWRASPLTACTSGNEFYAIFDRYVTKKKPHRACEDGRRSPRNIFWALQRKPRSVGRETWPWWSSCYSQGAARSQEQQTGGARKDPPNVYKERTQGRDSGLLSRRVALTSQACGPEVAIKNLLFILCWTNMHPCGYPRGKHCTSSPQVHRAGGLKDLLLTGFMSDCRPQHVKTLSNSLFRSLKTYKKSLETHKFLVSMK